MSNRKRRLGTLLLGLLLVALAGSIWAYFGRAACGSCQGAAANQVGQTLAGAGVAYYAILLLAAVLGGPSRFVLGGILLAAGVHGVLLSSLLATGNFCPPCLLTGGAAILAMIASFFLDPQNLVRASVILPASAVAAHVFVALAVGISAGGGNAAGPPDLPPAAAREFGRPVPKPGTARMVIYFRADCDVCQKLERDVLPGLMREFGEVLTVERRSAESLPEMPTPTLILSGSGGRVMFPGLPPLPDLRAAILKTLGEKDERQALLPAP